MAAAEAERSVCCLTCAPMAPGGIVNRLMGTCDIDGNGTTFNLPDGSPFECAGPFILGDLVSMPKVEMFKAPFCAHPHSGACVCSILMEGKEFRPWDNHRGAEPELLLPGGIYMLDAGRGCVHDEKPDAISVRGATKALFAEGDDPTGTGFSFCQLWFNPGRLESADERPMRSQVIAPAAIPLVTEGALSLRVLGGSYKGSASPLELPHELLLLHGRLEGGAAAPIELPPHFEGFIALVKDSGEGAVGSQPLSLGQVGRIGAGAAPLTLRATSDAPIFFLLGAGVPHEQPFAKLLGFGGALVEATPEAVRAKMQKCLPPTQRICPATFRCQTGFFNAGMRRIHRASGATRRACQTSPMTCGGTRWSRAFRTRRTASCRGSGRDGPWRRRPTPPSKSTWYKQSAFECTSGEPQLEKAAA